MSKVNILVSEDGIELAIKFRDRFGVIKPQIDRPATMFQFAGEYRDLIGISVYNEQFQNRGMLFPTFLDSLEVDRQKQNYIIFPYGYTTVATFADLSKLALIPNLKLVYAGDDNHAGLYAVGLIEKAAKYGVYARL